MNNSHAAPVKAWQVALALAAVYIIWGSTYFAIRIAVEDIAPMLMGAVRMSAAGLLMYIFLRWRGEANPSWRQWRVSAWMGVWLVLLANGLVNIAETEVSSGLAAIAVASMPLWAAIFSSLKGRHLSRLEWIGLLIGFIGVLWLNTGSSLRGSWIGTICLIIAPISWAWGSVWSRDQDLPGPFMSAATQMITGGLWMLVVGLLMGERLDNWPTWSAGLSVVYLITFGSIIGYTSYIWLLRHVRPALATSYAYVNPIIAVILGYAFLQERFTVHAIGAMLLIAFSVFLITRQKRLPTPAKNSAGA